MLPHPVLYLATYKQLLHMYVLQLPIKTLHLKSRLTHNHNYY
uniref:Uncharacterized protein n=1 Tax=Anguilla anguilla TaxID=7936 RepID=A0A0E9Y1J4_ANGAN